MKVKKTLMCGVVALVLGGCASNLDRLQLATCTRLNCSPTEVQVQDVQRSMTTVTWTAQTPQGAYNCIADDMVRQTVCGPQKGKE